MRFAFLTFCCIAVLPVSSVASELPKSAKPLAADEATKLYSGRSAVWSKDNSAYFAPDGSVKGVYKGGYFDGKWDVKDNEVCMRNQGTDSKTKKSDGKTYTDCWQWFKDGKGRLWTLWSVRYNGSKVPPKDYSRDEFKKFKDGDLVSKSYDKAKGA